MFPGDGLPQLLVADQDDGEGDPGQPPDRSVHGGQLESLNRKLEIL